MILVMVIKSIFNLYTLAVSPILGGNRQHKEGLGIPPSLYKIPQIQHIGIKTRPPKENVIKINNSK